MKLTSSSGRGTERDVTVHRFAVERQPAPKLTRRADKQTGIGGPGSKIEGESRVLGKAILNGPNGLAAGTVAGRICSEVNDVRGVPIAAEDESIPYSVSEEGSTARRKSK